MSGKDTTDPGARVMDTDLIRRSIAALVLESPENSLEHIDGARIWDAPLVGFADGHDPLFRDYKKIIGEFHLTPDEMLAQALPPGEGPDTISVICWVLPATGTTRRSNRRRELTPSFRWAQTRLYGERFNDTVREHVVSLLKESGHAAVAPMLSPAFKGAEREDGPASTWSERHAAYAAGLGTFSLSDGFITEAGVAIRCGSVVTDLPLAATGRTAADHYANCLYYSDGSCGECIDRCPAGAITAKGHDKRKCRAYMREELNGLDQRYGTEALGYAGCGLCQTGVPCESRIPVSNA